MVGQNKLYNNPCTSLNGIRETLNKKFHDMELKTYTLITGYLGRDVAGQIDIHGQNNIADHCSVKTSPFFCLTHGQFNRRNVEKGRE